MKFKIIRTSLLGTEKRPCKEARLEKITKIKHPDGSTYELKEWSIEIQNLKDLIKFVKKYGDLVLSCNKEGLEIEIYDTWRE